MSEPTPENMVPETRMVQWLSQLRAEMAETVNGVLLRGARPVQVGTGGTTRPTTSAGSLVGFALRNTSTVVAATVVLRDGVAGDIVIPLELAPGESVRDWFGPGGLNLSQGLAVDVAAGAVDGTVFLRGAE